MTTREASTDSAIVRQASKTKYEMEQALAKGDEGESEISMVSAIVLSEKWCVNGYRETGAWRRSAPRQIYKAR